MTKNSPTQSRSAAAERDFLIHVEQVAGRIGARPSADPAEMLAAGYVQGRLVQLGIQTKRQTFRSIDRFAARTFPQAMIAAVVAAFEDRLHPWVRGILGWMVYAHYRHIMSGHEAVWEPLLKWSQSQNVIACIPAQGEVTRRIVLTTGLDSSPERALFHPAISAKLPPLLASGSLLGLLSPLVSDDRGRLRWFHRGAALALGAMGVLSLIDESGKAVPGASGNAAAIAVLMQLAESLSDRPSTNTEIWLVFTGGTEAGNTGMAAFLNQHKDSLKDATFLVLDHIGSGELCWVTDHFLDPLVRYSPHPDAVTLVQQVAQANPQLGMMGRSMMSLDAVATLHHHGMKGAAIMGYDRLNGTPAHRFQPSDTVEHVDPTTLARAYEFLQALIYFRS